MSTSQAFDPVPALEVLARHGVRFVLIGGLAARALGSPLITRDIDICYARDDDNLERLAAALREVRAELRGVDEQVPFLLDAETLKAGDCFTFTTDVGSVDILGTPSGVGGFEDLSAGAERVYIGGSEVLVAAIDDLIRMKRAAGRPKDLRTIEELEALREEIEGIPEDG